MSYRKSLKSCVLATSSAAVIGAALAVSAGAPAFAQDAAATGDRVVVTGSRIVRRDFVANSPIVTVDSEAFESRSGLNIESYLNQLPQFNPAASPVTTEGDVQVTAVNSVGVATVSLRGLGANRNLVLIDGRRPTPVNALGVTDINAIPSALIQRVEIITGGASAVYGADAVGGVVNFILRDDFDGLELDSQYGITEAGDGEEFRISGIMGANFGDGRGNVTIGVEHYSRSAALEINRDWQRAEWANPLLGTGDFFNAGVHGYVPHGPTPIPGVTNAPSRPASDALFPNRPAGTSVCNFIGCGAPFPLTYTFNPDGTVYSNPGAFTGLAGLDKYRTAPVDGVEWAYQTVYNTFAVPGVTQEVTAVKWNNIDAYIQAPQDRYSFFASGTYDITDSITFYTRATFSESETRTKLFPSPAIGGWEAVIPYDPATDSPIALGGGLETVNPGFIPTGAPGAQFPVSPELAFLLNSRPVPDAPWQLNFIPSSWFDDRSTVNTITNWQLETGLTGELPFRDWTWDLYVSHAESATYNVAYGNFSLERYRALMTSPDYGRNARIVPNTGSVRPGFGNDPGICTSGFYNTIFGGDQAPSADCVYEISAPLQTRTQIQQNVGELNLQGGLFELPAGEVRAAAGFQYREMNAQFLPDILQSTLSFNDQVIGVYPAAYMDASTHVRDSYAELVVPLLSDLPFIQQFDVELGARYSDYDASPNEWTYKILGDWTVNDWLRLRGGYNRASRAPNLGELYLGRQMIFSVESTFSDPCGTRSSAPFGAGGSGLDPVADPGEAPGGVTSLASGQTAAGAASTRLICEAQMGAAAAAVYYGVSNAAGGATGVSFNWLYQEGNPNLDSEKADTWTFGGVISSPFESPWLSNITLSVDWYQLEITDAIQQYSINYARALCYGSEIVSTPAAAAARAASPECQNVGRVGGTTVGFAGGADTILLAYDNQATIETSGVDVAFNWAAQFEEIGLGLPGGLGINVQASILDYYRTKASPFAFDPEIDWVGTTGPTLTGTNPGAYDYRLFTTFSYFVNNLSFSLRWRHLPEVYGAGYASEEAIFANNQAVAGGAEGTILSFTPNNPISVATDAYDIFDFSFNWDVNETFALRGGVNNLFDKDPPPSGQSLGRPVDEWTAATLATVCDAYGGGGAVAGAPGPMGCINPTGYSLPNPGTAAAGYYDVIGRSFFVGVKARF